MRAALALSVLAALAAAGDKKPDNSTHNAQSSLLSSSFTFLINDHGDEDDEHNVGLSLSPGPDHSGLASIANEATDLQPDASVAQLVPQISVPSNFTTFEQYFFSAATIDDSRANMMPWKEVPHETHEKVSYKDDHDVRDQIIAGLSGILQKLHGYLDTNQSMLQIDMESDLWWPNAHINGMNHLTEQQKLFLIQDVTHIVGQDIRKLMIRLNFMPNHVNTPDIKPADRRPVKSEKITIATYNCEWLDIFGKSKFPNDPSLVHHFFHAVHIAKMLDRVDADVVVLEEVENFGIAELVRLMMKKKDEYRVYCSEHFDIVRKFRPVLLTRIDPIEPLGILNVKDASELRHFVAQLGVWVTEDGLDVRPIDIIGVHLPNYRDKERNVKIAAILQSAIIKRKSQMKLTDERTPLIVAGDINSSFVETLELPQKMKTRLKKKMSKSTNDVRRNVTANAQLEGLVSKLQNFEKSPFEHPSQERRTGLYVLHESTGLISCMTDCAIQTWKGDPEPIDHILVPVESVLLDRDICCQLETVSFKDDDMFAIEAWKSDHYPVRITFSLGHAALNVASSASSLTEECIARRRTISFSDSRHSFLSTKIASNTALLGSLSSEVATLLTRSTDAVDTSQLKMRSVTPETLNRTSILSKVSRAKSAVLSTLHSKSSQHDCILTPRMFKQSRDDATTIDRNFSSTDIYDQNFGVPELVMQPIQTAANSDITKENAQGSPFSDLSSTSNASDESKQTDGEF